MDSRGLLKSRFLMLSVNDKCQCFSLAKKYRFAFFSFFILNKELAYVFFHLFLYFKNL